MTDANCPGGVNPRFDFTADLPSLTQVQRVHLIAIGGSGMSGVARLLLARGIEVSGSDRADSATLDDLRAAGATVTIGQSAATADLVPADAWVVISSAIAPDNPELLRLQERGLPVLHRAQALGMLMAGRGALAVAGANGKTTTSAMATVALRSAGADPSYAIGAPIVGLSANADVGQGDSFVVEADESDGSFLVYHPHVAIVTNVRDDHLDFYGSSQRLHEAYADFAATVRPDGLLVVCADDEGSAALGERMRAVGTRVLTYGRGAEADLRLVDDDGSAFDWHGTLLFKGQRLALRLHVPGSHNLLNAAGVVLALSAGLDIDPALVVHGLAEFRGTARRFEPRGSAAGVRVVDDYAHNPGKVEAVVRTGLALRDGGRLIVVFQPHLYSRTQHAAAGLAEALSLADVAIVLDVYGAREAPVEGVTGELVTKRIDGAEAVYAPTHADALGAVVQRAQPGDLVLTVGAGDVTSLGPQILDALATRPDLP